MGNLCPYGTSPEGRQKWHEDCNRSLTREILAPLTLRSFGALLPTVDGEFCNHSLTQKILPPPLAGHGIFQPIALLLGKIREGVVFKGDRVDLARSGWRGK